METALWITVTVRTGYGVLEAWRGYANDDHEVASITVGRGSPACLIATLRLTERDRGGR